MDTEANMLKLIVQLLVSFASLLGVYVVFRLNSAQGAINNSWTTLDNSLDNLGNKIKHFPPREKLAVVFNWVGNPNDPISTRVDTINEILTDIFNQIGQKRIIINTFFVVLVLCLLVSEICLLRLWPFSVLTFLGFSLLLVSLFMFPVWALRKTTDWSYWDEKKEAWIKIYTLRKR